MGAPYQEPLANKIENPRGQTISVENQHMPRINDTQKLYSAYNTLASGRPKRSNQNSIPGEPNRDLNHVQMISRTDDESSFYRKPTQISEKIYNY